MMIARCIRGVNLRLPILVVVMVVVVVFIVVALNDFLQNCGHQRQKQPQPKQPQQKQPQQRPRPLPSAAHELARWRVEFAALETERFLGARLGEVRRSLSSTAKAKNVKEMQKKVEETSKRLEEIRLESRERLWTQRNDLNTLRETDYDPKWRERELKRLVDDVRARFDRIQNPPRCKEAKKLICQMDDPRAGFGHHFHDLMACFVLALAANRTLVVDSTGWIYNKEKGWEGEFLPLSRTCRIANAARKAKPGVPVKYQAGSPLKHPETLELKLSRRTGLTGAARAFNSFPLKIPVDLRPRLERLTRHPSAWWVGQIANYLFKPRPHILKWVQESKLRLGFVHPLVAVHVRRTNKVFDGTKMLPLSDYIQPIADWFDKREMSHPRPAGVKRRVFLATDEPAVINDTKAYSSTYDFILDNNNTNIAKFSRYTPSSLSGVIRDVYFMAEADFLVCTGSSNLCRLAYELMQSFRPDAADRIVSLDQEYIFNYQKGRVLRAVRPHVAKKGQIDLQVGDLIDIGVHGVSSEYRRGGFVQGTNLRTKKRGKFPSYKVEEIVHWVPFPVFG